MKTTLFSAILLLTFTLFGQVEQYTVIAKINSKRDSAECTAIKGNPLVLRNQDAVKRFNADLLICSDPSTLSIIGTDYHYTPSPREMQKKNFILNADLAFPIGIYGIRWYSRKMDIVHGFHLTPQVYIRILQDDTTNHYDSSMPVRTPSYLPRITYFISPLHLWNRNTDRNTSRRYYFAVSAFHHSNGQDGREFSLSGKYKNQANTYNGNFGENLAFEFIYGHILYTFRATQAHGDNKKRDSCPDHKMQRQYIPGIGDVQHAVYTRIGYEWHPKSLSNSDLWKLSYYGLNRLNFSLGYISSPSDRQLYKIGDTTFYRGNYKMIEKHRVLIKETIILDPGLKRGPIDNSHKATILERVNITVTYYNRQWFRHAANTAVFVQLGYYGSDVYNIYFNESMLFMRFGIAVGVFNNGNYLNGDH